MRMLPQRGFSRARRQTSSCTSRGIRGLPGVRRCLLLQLQYCRQAVCCQRITVSGRTSARADCHPGHIRESQDQNRRSAGWSLGRRCWRERTASCWRRARFSSRRSCRDRTALRRTEQRRRRKVGKAGPPSKHGASRLVHMPHPVNHPDTDDILPPYSQHDDEIVRAEAVAP